MTWMNRISCGFFTAALIAGAGCGDSEGPRVGGPVEGKRLDGTETALKTGEPNPAANVDPATPGTADAKDAKKKRDEWRDKKTGKPDDKDLIAQANIELRPALKDPQKAALTPVQRAALDALVTAAEKSALTPQQRSSAEQLIAGVVGMTLAPQEQAALDKVVAAIENGNAAASADPTAPAPYADPNNPDFVPADRNLYKKFDIATLKQIDGYLSVAFADLSGFPYSGMVGAPDPAPVEDNTKATDAKTTDAKTTDAKTTDTKTDEPKEPKHSIPDAIKALDKKKVAIKGYMMPIDFEDGGTNEFVLTRNIPSCFYCQPPQLNDWVEVKMKDGKRVPYIPDGIIELYGTLDVGEQREDGFIVNLYRMTGEKVVEMKAE